MLVGDCWPFVSIIIPIHNAEKTLRLCLNTVLKQDYKNIELVLVLDHCTDQSEEIASNLCKKCSFGYKILHTSGTHTGVSAARNLGLLNCSGDYVLFVDSDDYIEKNTVSYLINILRQVQKDKNEKTDMLIFGYVEHRGKNVSKMFYSDQGFISKEKLVSSILKSDVIGSFLWNKLISRKLFLDESFVEGVIFEDLQMIYRLILNSNMCYVTDRVLYHYIKSRNSLSERVDAKSAIQLYEGTKIRDEFLLEEMPDLKQDIAYSETLHCILSLQRLAKARWIRASEDKVKEIRKCLVNNLALTEHLSKKFYFATLGIKFFPSIYLNLYHIVFVLLKRTRKGW